MLYLHIYYVPIQRLWEPSGTGYYGSCSEAEAGNSGNPYVDINAEASDKVSPWYSRYA